MVVKCTAEEKTQRLRNTMEKGLSFGVLIKSKYRRRRKHNSKDNRRSKCDQMNTKENKQDQMNSRRSRQQLHHSMASWPSSLLKKLTIRRQESLCSRGSQSAGQRQPQLIEGQQGQQAENRQIIQKLETTSNLKREKTGSAHR